MFVLSIKHVAIKLVHIACRDRLVELIFAGHYEYGAMCVFQLSLGVLVRWPLQVCPRERCGPKVPFLQVMSWFLWFLNSIKAVSCREMVNFFPCLLQFQNSAKENTCIYKWFAHKVIKTSTLSTVMSAWPVLKFPYLHVGNTILTGLCVQPHRPLNFFQ